MKTIKLILAAAVISLFASHSAGAQEAKNQTAAPNQAVATAGQDRLALTKEQLVPYKEIIKRYAQRVRELKGSSLSNDEKREKLAVIYSEKDAEIKALLSPAQYQTYLQVQEEKKARYVQMKK